MTLYDAMSDTELVDAWLDNRLIAETIAHVGAYNRHFANGVAIIDELKRRAGGKPDALRPLLLHHDPAIRYTAALQFRTSDPATFQDAMKKLADDGGAIGRKAADILQAPPLRMPGAPARLRPDHPYLKAAHQTTPPAMKREDIEQRLSTVLPNHAHDIMQFFRLGLELWPRAPVASRPTGSRLGGMVFAPHDWQWPMADTEPMLFLAQIDCADLAAMPGADRLPSDGVFAFFGDHDAIEGCIGYGGAVFYWSESDNRVPVSPPLAPLIDILEASLDFRPFADLLDPNYKAIRDLLPDRDQWKLYREFHKTLAKHGYPEASLGPAGQLLGHPKLVQGDDFAIELSKPLDRYRLLLQINAYTNGNDIHDWGPGGSLYFFIEETDYNQGRWDQAVFAGQFT